MNLLLAATRCGGGCRSSSASSSSWCSPPFSWPPTEKSVGQRCDTCHHAENYDWANVPGHSKWHVAPIEMAWEGKTLGEICEQIKDPARNGNMNMEALLHHMAEDSLVGWAWKPGTDRTPAPGTQAEFGALMRAWAGAGAHCPSR